MIYERLHDAGDISSLIQRLNKSSSFVVIDTETTGLNPQTDTLIDIQLSGVGEDEAYIFPAIYAHWLMDVTIPFVAHNYKFDCHMLVKAGVDLRDRQWRDTMIMHHLVDENSSHSLEDIVKELWQDNYKEEFWSKHSSYLAAPQQERDIYACKDIVYTRKLYNLLVGKIIEESLCDLDCHVHYLAKCLLNTEINGVRVDEPYLMDMGIKLSTRVEELKVSLREHTKYAVDAIECEMWEKELAKRKTDIGKSRVVKPEFNFDSSKQLQDLLYSKLSLPVQKNEKTKQITTGEDALLRLKDLHPVITDLLEYKTIQKIYNTYIMGTLERKHKDRIYPSFNVNGTATGRISHSNPNLGQLPREGGVRGIYVPDEGCVFISADYDQLEVTLAAHFTQDKNLLKIVHEGASQHDITAAALGIDRQTAKTVNFALQYGATHFKLSKILGVSMSKAQEAFVRYWDTYSGQKALMEECRQKVDKGESIITPYGRRRRFPVLQRQAWDGAYRQAYNALIQGTGADITSSAFYEVDTHLRYKGIGNAVLTVHDEILIQCKIEHAKEAEYLLLDQMISIGEQLNLSVPLKAKGSGPMYRWDD